LSRFVGRLSITSYNFYILYRIKNRSTKENCGVTPLILTLLIYFSDGSYKEAFISNGTLLCEKIIDVANINHKWAGRNGNGCCMKPGDKN
jgi:hypothetical protein